MQPDNQQGYWQPDQNRPAQPVQPSPSPQPQPTPVARPAQQPVAQPAPVPQQAPVAAPAVQTALAEPALQSTVQIPAADDAQYDDDADAMDDSITWSAHEYIHQEKGALWFVIFTIVVVALLGLSIWTQAWSFSVLIAVIAVVVIVYSRRPPRELTYSLNDDGLVVDGKLHQFSSFKSFGIIRDGEEFSVMLIPTQRFQPGLSVYFPEEAGEDIVDMLGARLPMKDLKLDAVDRVVRLLRL